MTKLFNDVTNLFIQLTNLFNVMIKLLNDVTNPVYIYGLVFKFYLQSINDNLKEKSHKKFILDRNCKKESSNVSFEINIVSLICIRKFK